MTTQPFRAAKEFVLLGVKVRPGDVVDIAPAGLTRIKQMEDLGFGLRVPKDTPITSAKAVPAARVKRAPAAAKSSAAKKKMVAKKSTPTRKRAGKRSNKE